MKRERIIKESEEELSASGYSTVLTGNMHSCADLFAQGKGSKFIIKIVYNIDSVSRKEALDLYKMSRFLDAEPIILGEVSKNGRLKSNVVYSRFSVMCMSHETLAQVPSYKTNYIASKTFGVKTRINGPQLKSLRKLSDMTVTDLAKRTGISKYTLYKHEKTDDYASLHTVERIEAVLHESIKAEGHLESKRGELLTSKLASTGIHAITLDNAPFDIIAKSKNYYEISLDANIRTLIKRAGLFKLIKESFENNYPFFIGDGRKSLEGIPVIRKKELASLGSEEELLELVY